MRKFIASLFSLFSYVFFPSLAYAQVTVNPCEKAGVFDLVCKLGGTQGKSVGGVLSGFIFLFFTIAAIIAIIYLIYGGIKWIMSKGEKTEVEAARNHIIAAITGLIMVFLAFFLINFVIGLFVPGFSITNIQLPSVTQ